MFYIVKENLILTILYILFEIHSNSLKSIIAKLKVLDKAQRTEILQKYM